jgi:hypothetical protein
MDFILSTFRHGRLRRAQAVELGGMGIEIKVAPAIIRG